MQVVVLRRGEPEPGDAPRSGQDVLYHPLGDDGLGELLTPGRHVLLMAEARDALRLGRLVAELQVPGADLAVAGLSLPHGPLALSLMAHEAAMRRGSPAGTVAWLQELAGGTWSAAWLPRVGDLDRPAPSLGQHLRSWLPSGRGFLVEHAPAPSVTTLRRRHEPVRPVAAPLGGQGLPPSAVRLALELAGDRRLFAVSGPRAAARYGPGAISLAALPADVPEGPEVGLPSCAVCGVPLPQESCPFCNVRVRSELEEVS